MAPRTHYNILPVAGLDDEIQWLMHCNAVNCVIKYTALGFAQECKENKYLKDIQSKEEAIRVALQWAVQLNLIEVCE